MKKILLSLVFFVTSITSAGITGPIYNPANVTITGGTATVSSLTDTGALALTTVENAITAHAGGTQAACFALSSTATFHRVATVGSSADSVCLPAAVAGAVHCIRNDSTSGNDIQVFGTSPDTINGVATATGINMSKNVGACFVSTANATWNATGAYTQATGTGTVGVRQTSPTLTTPNIGVATATALASGTISATGKIDVALNGNTTKIEMAVRNTDATGSGAGQARIDWGNDSSASAGTIGVYSSTHASQPSQFEILNQANFPLQLGAFGSDVIALISAGVGNSVNSNRLLMSMTAPTISSGFGTSPTITANGATTFRINVGTGGTANGGVLTMPTATTGWNCQFSVLNPTSTNILAENVQTASTTTSVTISNELISTGSATAWPASTIIIAMCFAY